MKSIEERKDKFFKGVLMAVHEDVTLVSERDINIVAMTFEKTFNLLNKSFNTELRKNYLKKSKARFKKFKPSRLQNVE